LGSSREMEKHKYLNRLYIFCYFIWLLSYIVVSISLSSDKYQPNKGATYISFIQMFIYTCILILFIYHIKN